MLKVSRLSDYAVVLLCKLSMFDGKIASCSELSDKTGIPHPTVSKIFRLLSSVDFIETQRGINGGYKLLKDLKDITLLDVFEKIEGPVYTTLCTDGSQADCEFRSVCRLRGKWDKVNEKMKATLLSISLEDMIEENI